MLAAYLMCGLTGIMKCGTDNMFMFNPSSRLLAELRWTRMLETVGDEPAMMVYRGVDGSRRERADFQFPASYRVALYYSILFDIFHWVS
jgi:hypothetical protein